MQTDSRTSMVSGVSHSGRDPKTGTKHMQRPPTLLGRGQQGNGSPRGVVHIGGVTTRCNSVGAWLHWDVAPVGTGPPWDAAHMGAWLHWDVTYVGVWLHSGSWLMLGAMNSPPCAHHSL